MVRQKRNKVDFAAIKNRSMGNLKKTTMYASLILPKARGFSDVSYGRRQLLSFRWCICVCSNVLGPSLVQGGEINGRAVARSLARYFSKFKRVQIVCAEVVGTRMLGSTKS